MIVNTTNTLLEILNLEETIIIKTNTKTIAIVPHNGEISVIDKDGDVLLYSSEEEITAEIVSHVKMIIDQQDGD